MSFTSGRNFTIGPLKENFWSSPNKITSSSDITPNQSESKGRLPLGFLSPNRKWPRSSGKKRHKDYVELLEESTKSHLPAQFLEFKAGRKDLLHVIHEQELSKRTKDRELIALNVKLEGIQKGLAEIEKERQTLTDSSGRLESEKKKLERELSMREKEIISLSKRCSSQAEKMKEVACLKSAKDSLTRQVTELVAKAREKEVDEVSKASLRQQLDQSQASQSELEQLLKTVTKDYNEVAEKLRLSLQHVGKLMDQKREWEEERSKLLRRLELDLEQQRQGHDLETKNLKEHLREKDLKVTHLEQGLQEKVETIQKIREEVSSLLMSQDEKVRSSTEVNEKRLQELSVEHSASIANLETRFQADVQQLNEQMADKSALIERLQEEISTRMLETMAMSSSLERLYDDSKLLDTLTVDVEALTQETFDLKECLHERNTEIAELEADVLRLEMEKELLAQESHRIEGLRERVYTMEEEKTQMQSRLKSEVDTGRETIRLLEEELKSAEAKAQTMFDKHKTNQENISSTLRSHIANLNNEIKEKQRMHNEVDATKDSTITSLKEEMQSLADDFLKATKEHGSEMKILREEIKELKRNLAIKDSELQDLRTSELQKTDETIRGLRKEIIRLNRTINEKEHAAESTMGEMEQQLAQLRLRAAELEERAEEKTRDHQFEENGFAETIVDLRLQVDRLVISLKERDRKIEDQVSEVSHLAACLSRAQNERDEYRKKTLELRSSETSAKSERDNFVLALERESARVQSFESKEKEWMLQCETLRKEVQSVDSKLAAQLGQQKLLENAIQERDRLLSEALSQKNILEGRLERESSVLGALKQESNGKDLLLTEKGEEVRRLKAEWVRKENQYMEDIHSEQSRRQIIEADLAVSSAALKAAKKDYKDVTELEKENQLLKDKVRRQEVFLKRKLEKEKVMRERAVGKPLSVQSRPIRISKIPSPQKTRSAVNSRSTLSTASESSLNMSLDWELDSLLAD
jgi:chromosome segregation ATPase